jgi:hypothetical protein
VIVFTVLKGLPVPGNKFRKGLGIVADRSVFAAVSKAVAVARSVALLKSAKNSLGTKSRFLFTAMSRPHDVTKLASTTN